MIRRKLAKYPYPLTTLCAILALYNNYMFYTTSTPTNVVSYTDHYLYGGSAALMITLTIIAFMTETIVRQFM